MAGGLSTLLPDGALVSEAGRLSIGGVDLVELARAHGTPLYVYDAATVRARAGSTRTALAAAYPGPTRVSYAAKAYAAPWLLRVLAGEGLGVDVVSAGELAAALLAGTPPDRVTVHGNAKPDAELAGALDRGVGRIVVDSLDEIERLARLAASRGVRQAVLVRVGPGIEADTHAHLRTGARDTKFGLDLASGAAAEGARLVLASPSLEPRGFHAHVGSQIREVEPYRPTLEALFGLAERIRDETGFAAREISPGGGFGVASVPDESPIDALALVRQVGEMAAEAAWRHGFGDAPPELGIEPGRSIVATAGVALYTAVSVKARRGGRTFVAVDGGMADNIRPTAYGARYTALLANRAELAPEGREGSELSEVAIAGRYCEAGDVLIESVRLPPPRVGDLVAVPVSGAYQLAMASTYNLVPRPAVVVVDAGAARLVRHRETIEDLLGPELVDGAMVDEPASSRVP